VIAVRRTIGAEQHIYSFAPDLAPVASVPPGSAAVFETRDAFGGQIRSERDTISGIDFSRVNPATGPLAVEGVEPGDTLVVRVEEIEIRGPGVIVAGPGMGFLPDLLTEPATRIVPIEGGWARFGEVERPVAPMIGVIGGAPAKRAYPTGTAHRHGGNMDTREIGIGSILYLPVFRPGGMLALGDLHAVMADGEICVSGCEVAGRVRVRVDRIPGRCAEWPIVEANEEVSIVVSLPRVDAALREAAGSAVDRLRRALGLSTADAYMLCSLAVDFRISQLVDPHVTVKAVIPAALLSGSQGRPGERLLTAQSGGAGGGSVCCRTESWTDRTRGSSPGSERKKGGS